MLRKERERRVVERVRSLAKSVLGNDFSHGYPHVERVYRISWNIVENTGLDVDSLVLDTAIYLHDIGRVFGEPHAYYSSIIARPILEEHGLDNDTIKLIVNAIEYHSYSYVLKNNVKPLSIEAKILSDADKLDALGITGFLRVFHYGWVSGRSFNETINHFYEKIFKLPNLMHFNYTRELARKLVERTRRALDELLEEVNV